MFAYRREKAELARIQKQFPFPHGQIARARWRRWIFRYLPKGAVCAEIGVFRGHFATEILRHAAPRKLYLIDPWTICGEFFGWGGEYTNNDTLPTATARREVELRAAIFPRVDVRLLEDHFGSDELAIEEPLDWVYLDASHHYEHTLAELRKIADVLKPDGMIAGDDWWPDPSHQHHGVFRAVQTFVRTAPFEIVAAGPGNQYVLRGTAADSSRPALANHAPLP